MTTAQGTVDHCQNTTQLSGGGNNGTVSTTYIALFRLAQRQVQFSSNSPLPVSNGDEVVVAGRLWRGELRADAVRNLTTGVTRQAGIFSRILFAVFLFIFGTVFVLFFASSFPFGRWFLLLPAAGALYLLFRAAQITRAWFYVRSITP